MNTYFAVLALGFALGVLFAAAGDCCYPVTGETLVKPVYAFALCAAALLMAAGIIPLGAGKEGERIHE